MNPNKIFNPIQFETSNLNFSYFGLGQIKKFVRIPTDWVGKR